MKKLTIILALLLLCTAGGRKKERIETPKSHAVLQLGANDGPRAWDWSEYGNVATIIGTPTWGFAYGVTGAGWKFDQVEYFSVADSASLDITRELTMSVWLNFNGSMPPNHGIFDKGDITKDQGDYSLIIANSNVYFRLNQQITEGAGQITIGGLSSDYEDGWNMYTATYDGAQMRLYLNGEHMSNAAYSTAISVNAYPLYIGVYFATNHSYVGSIDELYVFDKALPDVEIKQLYEQVKARQNP